LFRQIYLQLLTTMMEDGSHPDTTGATSRSDQSKSGVATIIIATDHGERMRSAKPKVLHECAGLPLIAHTVRLAVHVGASSIVVVVSPLTLAPVRNAMELLFPDLPVIYAVQEEQQGAWDAARVGLSAVPQQVQQVVILHGDMPLLQQSDLAALKEAATYAPLALLTASLDGSAGFDRIVRDERGQVQHIVGQHVATNEQLSVVEVETAVYWAEASFLHQAFADIDDDVSKTKPDR
jgi:bifunctional UDP-N-acetylglucosamine pyrophosphorylase/glucosamine-1-phosphate N-acetyltransferase